MKVNTKARFSRIEKETKAMDHNLQLKHPQRKKAVRMSGEKYKLLKSLLVKHLRAEGQASFADIVMVVERELKKSKKEFQGSLPWYLEWVKLDLEARRIIKRVAGTSPQRYMLK